MTECREEEVSGIVPELVVDILEVIGVQEKDGGTPAGDADLTDSCHEAASIGETCQDVVECLA